MRDLQDGILYAQTPTQIKTGRLCRDTPMPILSVHCAGCCRSGRVKRGSDLIDNNLKVFHSIVGAVMGSGFDGIFLGGHQSR